MYACASHEKSYYPHYRLSYIEPFGKMERAETYVQLTKDCLYDVTTYQIFTIKNGIRLVAKLLDNRRNRDNLTPPWRVLVLLRESRKLRERWSIKDGL